MYPSPKKKGIKSVSIALMPKHSAIPAQSDKMIKIFIYFSILFELFETLSEEIRGMYVSHPALS